MREREHVVGYTGGSHLHILGPEELCGGARCDYSAPGMDSETFQLLAGDFNGDGLDDLVWLPTNGMLDDLGYELYLLHATSTGFEKSLLKQRIQGENPSAAARRPLVRDLDGDGAKDLVLSFVRRDGVNTVQEYQIAMRIWPSSR